MENLHPKTLLTGATISAIVGALVSYLFLTFGMSTQIRVNTGRLDRLEQTYLTRDQFNQFQKAAEQNQRELHDFMVRQDAWRDEHDKEMRQFGIEHARLFLMLEQIGRQNHMPAEPSAANRTPGEQARKIPAK
ncbi:MAG: hypothetical protein WBQ94_04245 [Terracidiphilus sp.]